MSTAKLEVMGFAQVGDRHGIYVVCLRIPRFADLRHRLCFVFYLRVRGRAGHTYAPGPGLAWVAC